MTRLLIAIFIILFFSTNSASQTKSLDSFYLDKINYYKNTNNDSLFFYCEKLEQSNNICKSLEGSTGKSYGFYRKKDYDKAESISLELSNKLTLY